MSVPRFQFLGHKLPVIRWFFEFRVCTCRWPLPFHLFHQTQILLGTLEPWNLPLKSSTYEHFFGTEAGTLEPEPQNFPYRCYAKIL